MLNLSTVAQNFSVVANMTGDPLKRAFSIHSYLIELGLKNVKYRKTRPNPIWEGLRNSKQFSDC